MICHLQSPGIEQYAMRAFSDALDAVPMALAENSGLSPIETLASIKSRQVKENNSRLGVDCMLTGNNGMCTLDLLYDGLLGTNGTCRYAGALRHRSFDQQATATAARHSALPHGSEGKYLRDISVELS